MKKRKIFPALLLSVFFLVIALILFKREELTEEEKKVAMIRKELLNHYAEDRDSLKREAAIFLTDHLLYKFGLEGRLNVHFADTLAKYQSETDTLIQRLAKMKSLYPKTYVKDIDTLNAAYLINQIDKTFDVLERAPWIKMDERQATYFEYVLPYRVHHEPLSNWREDVQAYGLDSVFQFSNLRSAGAYILEKLSERKKDFVLRWGKSNPGIPDSPFSTLDLLGVGSCKELSEYTAFALRAYGLPVSNDFTPNYSNIGAGHNWNALVMDQNHSIPFIIPIKDSLGHFRNDRHIIPKVYRETFSVQKESHAYKKGTKTLPGIFSDPFLLDVTHQYTQTMDLSIEVDPQLSGDDPFVYLQIFNNKDWVPVGWGETKAGRAQFKNVGVHSIYLPAMTDEYNQLFPVGYPVLVDSGGTTKTLKPDLQNRMNMTALRKYPLFPNIQSFIERMIGGTFQGANYPDFRDAVTLYKIKESPGQYFNSVAVNANNKKFKYVRYLGPEQSYANIAEMEIYGGGELLNGKLISDPNNHFEKTKAFDGDVLTYVMSSDIDYGWVGIAFSQKQAVDSIRFIARTDYNIIVPGNEYELFYWNKEMVSLGRKIATSHELFYKDVPSNALYIIHNHTEGQEERIFTYENGKQVWW